MAYTRLQIYNMALRAFGERSIASLSVNEESRLVLDEIWTEGDGAVRALLEQGLWNFALRSSMIDSSASVAPAFGFTYAFDKPTDFVRLDMISADERFTTPLNDYELEGDYFYSDADPIYMRYVSDDAEYGLDYAKWTDGFAKWGAHWLAVQAAPLLKSTADLDRLFKMERMLLDRAKSVDASEEPTRFRPMGNWARSRLGRSRLDRGKRNQLIG